MAIPKKVMLVAAKAFCIGPDEGGVGVDVYPGDIFEATEDLAAEWMHAGLARLASEGDKPNKAGKSRGMKKPARANEIETRDPDVE